jgi:hypothetical protein
MRLGRRFAEPEAGIDGPGEGGPDSEQDSPGEAIDEGGQPGHSYEGPRLGSLSQAS